MSHTKIRPTHLGRKAVVYLRQSTMKQVYEHRESTQRQYGLSRRASELGWRAQAIEIIDEDLGQSGASSQWRSGFKRLAEEVSRGRVGAIFALEVSRLARSSADWHQLLDLCGWTDVLIVDEQAIYAPNDPNDRLLLGLKGQMSEAEKYWMRLRLHGARDSKARRGELRLSAPVGYVWDSVSRRLRFDPDEEIQSAVKLVFERFRIDGSAGGVAAYFIAHGLEFPRRVATGEVVRRRLVRSTLLSLLHNPVYTGAYVYGRREFRTVFSDGQLKRNQCAALPIESWKACLHDHHPAYITWEEFVTNQKKIDGNRHRRREPGPDPGAPRNGEALLQGLVLCGRCGYRMTVQQGGAARPRYICTAPVNQGRSAKACWSVAATAIDAAVVEEFIKVCQPSEVELSLAVTVEVQRQANALERQWKARLDRAAYEAQLAERRYKAVDPDNRVVARTLEVEWESKLREVEELRCSFEQTREVEKVTLTPAERDRIRSLARDLPRVWGAKSTTNSQRKNLLRTLVQQVTLLPVDVPQRSTRIQILWHTDAVTECSAPRPRVRNGLATAREIVDDIRVRASRGQTDGEIAVAFNKLGVVSARQVEWNEQMVRGLRKRHGIRSTHGLRPGERWPAQREDGLVSTRGVAERLGVSARMVRSWVEQGLLMAREGGGHGRTQWFKLDAATTRRLKAAAKAQRPRRRSQPPTVVEGGES